MLKSAEDSSDSGTFRDWGPNILEKAGITPRLDLPVGENVQEHAYVSLSYGRSSFVSYSFHNSYFLPELKDGVPG